MKRCLIVGRDRVERDRLKRLLSVYGFDLAETSSSDDALSRCRSDMPDVVVVGADETQGPGLTFLRRLKRSKGGDKPVVLFCAERAQANEIGQAIWAGASECVMKPFTADILDQKLRQAGAV